MTLLPQQRKCAFEMPFFCCSLSTQQHRHESSKCSLKRAIAFVKTVVSYHAGHIWGLTIPWNVSLTSTKGFSSWIAPWLALILYVVGVPIITLLLLYRYHYLTSSNELGDDERHIGTTSGLSFLYENYSCDCWFWEVLELARKIILTSVIVFIGGQSRTILGVAAIMSGLYTVLFASYQPISDRFEHWLQLMSLLATCANMNVGMLQKIPEGNISGIRTKTEEVGVTVLLVFVNLLVTGMMIGKLYFVTICKLLFFF